MARGSQGGRQGGRRMCRAEGSRHSGTHLCWDIRVCGCVSMYVSMCVPRGKEEHPCASLGTYRLTKAVGEPSSGHTP